MYNTYFNVKKGVKGSEVPRWIGIEKAAIEMDSFIVLVDLLKETIDHEYSKIESITDRELQFKESLSKLTRQYSDDYLYSPDPLQSDLLVTPFYITQIGNLTYSQSDVYKVNNEFSSVLLPISQKIESSRAYANSLVEKGNLIIYNLQNVKAQLEFVNDTLISLNEDILQEVYNIVKLCFNI